MHCLADFENTSGASLPDQAHSRPLWLHPSTLPSLPLSDITTAPHLSRISLFSTADCSNSSETHFVGTVDASNHNNSPTLSTTTQPFCPDVHNASILCGTHIYGLLPSGWSGTCALLSPFPEFLLVPITGFLAAQSDKQAFHILPLLTALGITGITTGTAIRTIYH